MLCGCGGGVVTDGLSCVAYTRMGTFREVPGGQSVRACMRVCVCLSSAPRSPSGTQAEDCSAPFTMRLFEVAPEALKSREPGL